MVFLESIAGGAPATTRPEVDERAARRTLRDQIARLERDLGAAVVAAYPRLPPGTARGPPRGPRGRPARRPAPAGARRARAHPRRPGRPPRGGAWPDCPAGRAPGGAAGPDPAAAAPARGGQR